MHDKLTTFERNKDSLNFVNSNYNLTSHFLDRNRLLLLGTTRKKLTSSRRIQLPVSRSTRVWGRTTIILISHLTFKLKLFLPNEMESADIYLKCIFWHIWVRDLQKLINSDKLPMHSDYVQEWSRENEKSTWRRKDWKAVFKLILLTYVRMLKIWCQISSELLPYTKTKIYNQKYSSSVFHCINIDNSCCI
jgi:hypothetical protein